MKGLLRKDLYMAWRYCRSYLLILLVFSVLSIWGESSFLLSYPMFFAGIIPVTLISYDEKSRWNAYAATLPCSRAQCVSVKYLVTLLCILGTTLVLLLFQTIGMAVRDGFSADRYMLTGCLIPAAGILVPALLLPAVFRFGAEKGRIAYFAVVIAFFVLLALLDLFLHPEDAAAPAGFLPTWVCLTALACAALLFAASWVLSVLLYKKRDL